MSVKREMWLMCPCGCEEYSQKTVVEHMERIHPEMLFKCNVNQCGRLFWKLCDLKEHIEKSENHSNFRRDHENLFNVAEFFDKQSRSYTLQFIGLKVSSCKLALEGFIEYPVDLREYRCRVCKANKTHFSSFLLSCAIRHGRNIHPAQPSSQRQIKYKCRECGRDEFCSEMNLQNHIDEKHGPPLQMSAKSRLGQTIKADSESEIQITEVKCVPSSRVCNSTEDSLYESSGPRLSAVPTVNGEGDTETCHPCSFCRLRIPESESNVHLKIHYDELFKCDICQLGFEEYRKVVQHLKTVHKVGDRCRGLIGLPMQTRSLAMLKCEVRDCGRKFIGQNNEMALMVKHITKSHGQYYNSPGNKARFFCRICEDLETFDFLEDVEDHIKNKHRRQLVALNSSSEEDTEKDSPLAQQNRRDVHADEPPRKVVIIEEPRKCTIQENKQNHKESRRKSKPSQYKLKKAKKREKKKYRNDGNDLKDKSKPHPSTKHRSSKSSKTGTRLNNMKYQPKWPQLIKEVPTAAIKELLENVTTATVVASTIEKKLKRNKTKLESKPQNSKSRSSSLTETSTNSESETEDEDITSTSDVDTRVESSKLHIGKSKPKINMNSALLKRMNNNITLEERLAYCLGKYKPEEKISQITGETLRINKHTSMDKVTDVDDEMQKHTEQQHRKGSECEMEFKKADCLMLKRAKELSTPGQNRKIIKDEEPTVLYCEFCEKQFPDASSICGHIYKDHRSLLFRCKMCTSHAMLVSGFVSTRGLLFHLRNGHGLKGTPNELLGNVSLVELPEKFLQKIVCVNDGCKSSAEIGRKGLWLGRDFGDVKDLIVGHNLFTHKSVAVGDRIELCCRICCKFRAVYSKDDENELIRWRTHCAQSHFKLLNCNSGYF